MAEETTSGDPIDIALADLKARREQIDHAIAALLAVKGQKTVSNQIVSNSENVDPEAVIKPGTFLGMSIAEAAKQLLSIRKKALGTPEITESLMQGGVAFSGETPGNTVGSVLHREAGKTPPDVISVGRGKWALAAWHKNAARFQKKDVLVEGDENKPDA